MRMKMIYAWVVLGLFSVPTVTSAEGGLLSPIENSVQDSIKEVTSKEEGSRHAKNKTEEKSSTSQDEGETDSITETVNSTTEEISTKNVKKTVEQVRETTTKEVKETVDQVVKTIDDPSVNVELSESPKVGVHTEAIVTKVSREPTFQADTEKINVFKIDHDSSVPEQDSEDIQASKHSKSDRSADGPPIKPFEAIVPGQVSPSVNGTPTQALTNANSKVNSVWAMMEDGKRVNQAKSQLMTAKVSIFYNQWINAPPKQPPQISNFL